LTWQPEDFEDLGSELRRRVGAELRGEAEEIERLSDLQRRRKDTLREVAQAAMHRGDSVTIAIGERTWKGTLRAVGDDYLQIESQQSVVECPLSAAVISVERSRSGGRKGKPASATWKARLAELAAEQTRVQILIRGSEELAGLIKVTAADHLELSSEEPTYIPLDLIVAIISVP
jgi:hypothetical protein